MSFSQRVKSARLFRGMNQSQLARASGLTRAAISKWESNPNSKPDATAALSVAKALGVPFEGLIAETKTNPNREMSKADSARGEELFLLLRNHLQTVNKPTRTALLDCLERLDHTLTLLPEGESRLELEGPFRKPDQLKRR